MVYETAIGIIGLALVILSFLQKSIKLTYGFNSVGSVFLAVYSYTLSNWIFFVLNIAIVTITAYDFLYWKRKGVSRFFHKDRH